jgi:hypothetical protein
VKIVEIVLLGVVAAVVYGILHDQVTARVCVEYFTVFHPPVFETTSPTLLGLGWGIIATWWVGLPLGGLLAIAARAGSRTPQYSARDLVRPVSCLMAAVGSCALVAGIAGWWLTAHGHVSPPEWVMSELPGPRHAAFMADAWAHETSYTAGEIGGVILAAVTWLRRRRAGS